MSLVKSSVYEERWYWSCGIIGVCTILDGIMRCINDRSPVVDDTTIHFYMGHMVMPTVFWNAILGGIGHKMMGLMEEKEDYIW